MVDVLGSGFDTVLLVVVLIMSSVVIAITLAAFMFAIYWFYLRYNVRIVIFSKDGLGNVIKTIDRGGLFKKAGQKKLWFRKAKLGIDPDKIKYIYTGKKRTTYFIKTGEKGFRPLNFKFNEDLYNINVGEEDVNWGISQIRVETTRFAWKDLWQQYLPIALWVLFSVFILIVLFQLFKRFDVLEQVAKSLEHAATSLAEASMAEGGII